MVAAGGLLQQLQVLVQLLLGTEGDAVDTGQHLVVLVVFPVGAGLLGDLECLQALGVGQVRSDAHVNVLALLEEAELGLVLQISHVLDLVLFAALLHQLDGLVTGQDEGLDRQVFLADLLHFLLDGGQVLVGQLGVAQVHVIVEAVVGGRTKGKVCLGVQALDGLCHDVGCGVAQHMQFLVLRALGHGTVLVDDLHKMPLLWGLAGQPPGRIGLRRAAAGKENRSIPQVFCTGNSGTNTG